MKIKLVRITTVPISLHKLLNGQLKFMNNYFDVIGISSPGWELEKISEQQGVKTIAIEMSRTPNLFKDLVSLYRLTREIRNIAPHIVHTHTPKAGLLGIIAAYLNKVPIRLHTVAGIPWIEYKGFKRKTFMFIEFITYKFSTHIYCNSFHLMEFILGNKLIEKSKISVIGNGSSNGINTKYFCPSDELIEKSLKLKNDHSILNEKVLIYVGRLVKDKGIEELIEAFVTIKLTNPNLKLLLVGPFEPHRDQLTSRTLEIIKSDPDIIMTGYVEDIRPYLCLSHLLVFPSYREGFPNVPMQAGAFGLPSIVTNINGCNEIIIEGVNGILIRPKNSNDLIKSINKILTDIDFYNRLSKNCRKLIVDRFEQEDVWIKILIDYNLQLEKL